MIKHTAIHENNACELLGLKEALGSWQAIADEIDVKKPTVWKFCNKDNYLPKSYTIKRRLGIKPGKERPLLDCYDQPRKQLLKEIRDLAGDNTALLMQARDFLIYWTNEKGD